MTEAFRVERASALLVRHRLRLRTGCDAIDALLGGGIPARGITEISGESSAGKTQVSVPRARAPMAARITSALRLPHAHTFR